MPLSDCFVSVVAPLWNDAAIVDAFVTETMNVLAGSYTNYELVLVDDGSRDDTVERMAPLLARHAGIRLLRLSRHFGTEIALTSGLETSIGDFVVVMMPDSDPPTMIPNLVEECRRGRDILFGLRTNASGDPWWRRLLAGSFYAIGERFFDLRVPRHVTRFQVFSRQALNAVIRIKDKYRYLQLLSSYVGYQRNVFTYIPLNRYGRPRTRPFGESVRLAFGLLTTNSAHPLRVVSMLGLVASIVNALYVVYVLLIYWFKKHVAEGWTTLSLQHAGMFFFVFLILTVMSEYIGHILDEIRERPLYYILEEKTSSVIPDEERRNIVTEAR